MSITAEELDDWIGSEVVDASDEKLGKVTEVYYRGQDPVIVEFRSGLLSRKSYLATLTGASVSMKHLRLGSDETVATDGGLDADTLAQLASLDGRLSNVTVEQIESQTARAQRQEAARQAAAHADTLDAEATHRADEAKVAARVAKEAAENSAAAELASRNARTLAVKARQEADRLSR